MFSQRNNPYYDLRVKVYSIPVYLILQRCNKRTINMKVASKFFKVSAVNPRALVQKYKNHKQHPHSQKTAIFVLAGKGFFITFAADFKNGVPKLVQHLQHRG